MEKIKETYLPPIAELTCFVPAEEISQKDTVMTDGNAWTFFSAKSGDGLSFGVTDPGNDFN